MKNKFTLLIVLAILLSFALGCSMLNPFSGSKERAKTERSNSNSGGTTTDGSETTPDTSDVKKIGIPECDEVVDMLTKEMNDPDDNYISRAIKETVYNSIRESLRKSLEEGKNDPKALARKCTDLKENLIKEKAKQDTKKPE